MIELEKTYLAKHLPKDLEKSPSKEIIDVYFPKEEEHPKIRIRKRGGEYRITKKQPIQNGDASVQKEQTIVLTEKEFESLNKLEGKRVRKIRYYYPFDNRTAEVDVFQDDLKGLVTVDFEFETEQDKEKFEMPDFCLADVTQEDFIAGGKLCGKTYKEIEKELDKFEYKKL